MESSVPHCPTLIPAALGENLYSCSSVSVSLCHQTQPSSSWSRYHFHQGTVASWTCGTLWLCLLPSAFHHLATRLCTGSLPCCKDKGIAACDRRCCFPYTSTWKPHVALRDWLPHHVSVSTSCNVNQWRDDACVASPL